MKVVYDTCLYIDLLRSGARLDLFRMISHLRYLSPIVLMELKAGARTPTQERIVNRLIEPYSKARRIIPLGATLYERAGEILARLGSQSAIQGLSHDLLIALSARSIGATLFTSNRKHFQFFKKFLPVKMEFV